MFVFLTRRPSPSFDYAKLPYFKNIVMYSIANSDYICKGINRENLLLFSYAVLFYYISAHHALQSRTFAFGGFMLYNIPTELVKYDRRIHEIAEKDKI